MLSKQLFEDFLPGQTEVARELPEDRIDLADGQLFVCRDGDVVLAVFSVVRRMWLPSWRVTW